ncbi:MAG: NAD(P)H-binding protein [Candidatus Lokiarchaeota archaeon]|nr:NAD(P)H-binding protein [Candidatus Lokiarchaeota archaeon]MBD3200233.1 NAD(P)H-binding protein [Candidatus Lokiarchaeota archaeon]
MTLSYSIIIFEVIKIPNDINWILYGAYGYTGRLIAKESIKAGLKPVLAGRNPNKLIPLAKKKNLEYRVFSLKNRKEIIENIKDFDIIFNAAGPFEITSLPIVKSCLKTSTNYLDITGEIGVFEQNFSFHNEALEKEIVIVSGVGFDVVPSDCLAKYVSGRIEKPKELEIGIAGMSGFSGGTLKTMLRNLPHGTAMRRNGKIITAPLGRPQKEIQFIDKKRNCYALSWGDISTAYRSTKISNINVYMALPKAIKYITGPTEPLVRKIFELDAVQNITQSWISNNIKGPNKKVRQKSSSYLWAKVQNDNGESYQAWLKTIEAYRLTAVSAVKCVKKVSRNNLKGVLTPSNAFGEDFILDFPDTMRLDSLD